MKQAQMLIEHGLIPGHTLNPDQPGMENSSSIIPDDQKMNPNCTCPVRTCPLHGYCGYCSQHHAELSRALTAMGMGQYAHYHHCKQDIMLERYGHEEANAMVRKEGEAALAAARAARTAEEEDDTTCG